MKNYTDVAIVGAGMAGITLALQLHRENPNLSITIIEKRKGKAPIAAHKVGESTVELGTYYLREVLDLKDYLDKYQLPKKGLRYFLSPENKGTIEKRLEIGAKNSLIVPSHQIDRGIFENDMIALLQEKGITYIDDTKVRDVDINKKENHTLYIYSQGEKQTLDCRWVIDTSGRGFFLKRKLKLKKELNHPISSAWFRLKGVVDVNDWSDNKEWKNFLEPDIRRLGTCHLMDQGYWLWIIPLVSGNTSIGIVADPKFHALKTYNTFEKAMNWIKENEPLAYQKFQEYDYELMDFNVLNHFPYDTKKYYSNQRWATTGEAGSFLDPFYSPGTDLIAINNTFVADLILKDFAGEDYFMPAMLYDITYNELIKNWVPVYKDKYTLFGSSQIMIFKIFWDWALYWSFPSLIFINKGYTDIKTLKRLFTQKDSVMPKVAALGKNVQDFFLDWLPYDNVKRDDYIDFIEMDFIHKMHFDLNKKFTQEELLAQIDENIIILEQVATDIFKRVSKDIFDLEEIENINPYTFTIKDGKEAMIALCKKSKNTEVPESITKDINKMWYK